VPSGCEPSLFGVPKSGRAVNTIDEDFIDSSTCADRVRNDRPETIDRQLMRAGVRLARLLNEAAIASR